MQRKLTPTHTTLVRAFSSCHTLNPHLLLLNPPSNALDPRKPQSQAPHQRHHPCPRSYHSSPCLLKKAKPNFERTDAESSSESDPFDFSALESGISATMTRLEGELSKLKGGGRFNPELVDGLRVTVRKGERESVRLGDLAQVVPKGRVLVVLVGEVEHVKPIISAILGCPHSLNPTPSKHSPLELHIPIPPPTQESRQVALTAATKAGEHAANGVQKSRGVAQKRLRGLAVKKLAGPDDLKKAGERMEKIVEKAAGEVKRVVEGARKGLERV